MKYKLVSDRSIEVNGTVFNTDFPVVDLTTKQVEDFKWYINQGIITEATDVFLKVEKIKDVMEDAIEKIKESAEIIIKEAEEVVIEVKETVDEIKEIIEDKKVVEKQVQSKKKK